MRYKAKVESSSGAKAKKTIRAKMAALFLKSRNLKELLDREEAVSPLKKDIFLKVFTQNYTAIRDIKRQTKILNSKPGRYSDIFNNSGQYAYEKSNHFNLFLTDPTADIDVINFCASIPMDIYYNETGNRLLMRNTFASLIPNRVLESNAHGIQAADIGHRLIAEMDKINEILLRFERNPAVFEYIDIQKIRSALFDISESYNSHTFVKANLIVSSGISLGLFIDQF